MENEKKPKIYTRDWINADNGSAYMIVQASVEDDWQYSDGLEVDAAIEIKDCSRQINLDFNYGNQEEYNQRLDKLNLMVSRLQALKDFMVAHPPVKGTIKRERKPAITPHKSFEEPKTNEIKPM